MWTTSGRLLAGRLGRASSVAPGHLIATTHHAGVTSKPSMGYALRLSSSSIAAPGPFARLGRLLKNIFGQKDVGPRELQEKKDLYWILLATTHRDLRVREHAARRTDSTKPPAWAYESRDDLRRTMEESAQRLDDEVKVNEMSLAQIRKQVQIAIESQVTVSLEGAQVLEQAMEDLHGNRDADDDEYKLSSQEEDKFREVLVKEYEKTVEAIEKKAPVKRRTSDPIPFLVTKRDAIETVLSHFGWQPEKFLRSNELEDDDHVDAFGFKPNQAETDMVDAMRYYHARNLVRSSLAHCVGQDDEEARRQRNHSLIPFKSTLEEAGRGVFVDGFAPAGTLMAFFPGKVWPKERLSAASVQSQLELANDPLHQLAMRYDDYLIDSRKSPYTVVKNLWAIAHIVNHPPLRTTGTDDVFAGPNCVTCSINFTEAMFRGQQDKLRDYLPNEYEHPPQEWATSFFGDEKVVMHGIGLFALRDLEDEELFFDYRLSPDDRQPNGRQYPHWYRVIDEEAVKNRWNLDEEHG